MYCPTCGNEISAELKYCNRCGANLTLPVTTTTVLAPVKLNVPSIMLGLTVIIGLGVIFGGANAFAEKGVNPLAIVWMVLFGAVTLFGCTALLIRFLTNLLTMQREISAAQPQQRPVVSDHQTQHHLPPPRMEPIGSVTENTTRTFSPIYREPADRGRG